MSSDTGKIGGGGPSRGSWSGRGYQRNYQRGSKNRGGSGRGGGGGKRGYGGRQPWNGSSGYKFRYCDVDGQEFPDMDKPSGSRVGLELASLSPVPPVPEEDRRTAKDINYWRYEYYPSGPVPVQPFQFELPETDDHLEALKLMRELREERQLLKDQRTGAAMDCRGSHSILTMCQFCDGRRGSWVVEDQKKGDPGFLRYQESIINSGPGVASCFLVDEGENPKGQQEEECTDFGISSVNVSLVG